MNAFVKIEHLSHYFSPDLPAALVDIQAEFFKGQLIGLVGPDGAGKTTLIRLMMGLLIPSQGRISVGGWDSVREGEKIHEISGYMPQRFGLYEDLSVMENLELYADLRGVLPNQKRETFQKLLEFTHLSPFTKRLARDLSGGMKQKLGLSCALLKKPELLVLDEPSVGVDPISRRELWLMVHELLDDQTCIVWSTAYLDEAEKCDRVLLLNEGKLYFFGAPQELTDRVKGKVFYLENVENKRARVRELMGRQEVIDSVIVGDDIRLVLQHPIEDLPLKSAIPRLEDAFVDLLGGKGDQGFQVHNAKDLKAHNAVEFPVEADHLTKKFGGFIAANEVSFQVKRGEVFGLLGPNGAGKSTTFKMLCGLLSPTNGNAAIDGIDLRKSPALARSHIGYMAQKFSLYGNLTVQQNLDFFAGVYGVADQAIVKAMIQAFSLTPYLSSFCDTLPIGFKQRLSFAIATLHDPAVLFLDEPTSGMDPLTRRAFWRQISALAENGCTIMVTTHFVDEAENCDRIALLYRGEIIYLGTCDALKQMAKDEKNLNPTLEDAFIKCIESK